MLIVIVLCIIYINGNFCVKDFTKKSVNYLCIFVVPLTKT